MEAAPTFTPCSRADKSRSRGLDASNADAGWPLLKAKTWLVARREQQGSMPAVGVRSRIRHGDDAPVLTSQP